MIKVLENRLERIQMAIEKGYTANIESGEVFTHKGKLVTSKTYDGYIRMSFNYNGKIIHILAHQFIWYLEYKIVVNIIDHINGNKIDNRISNIRSVTKQENAFNQSKAKGYTWDKTRNKWLAMIMVDSKNINLGSFINESDARQAYLAAKEKYHIIN